MKILPMFSFVLENDIMTYMLLCHSRGTNEYHPFESCGLNAGNFQPLANFGLI
jgi:hypothetical protein